MPPLPGLEMLVVQSNNRIESVERFAETWLGCGVESCRSSTMRFGRNRTKLARFPRVISVVVDFEISGSRTVENDIDGGMRQAVELLYRQNRRKIVCVLEDLETKMNRIRHRAFLDEMDKSGVAAAADQLCLATKGWSDDAAADQLPSKVIPMKLIVREST